MKQQSKSQEDLLNVINKIQLQLNELDKKLDTLIHRSTPEQKSNPKQSPIPTSPKPNAHHHERVMYKAICADCNKECTIPFKPSGIARYIARIAFRRKVIHLSGIKIQDKPKEIPPVSNLEAKTKKKMTVKKAIGKKKTPVKNKKR